MTTPKKEFDSIQIKRDAQEAIYEAIKKMTPEEVGQTVGERVGKLVRRVAGLSRHGQPSAMTKSFDIASL